MSLQHTYRLLATLTLVAVFVGTLAVILVFGVLSNSKSVQSFGTVKAVNVGVYWDSGCTNATSTVNWGMLSPGGSKNVTLYVRNGGNVAVRLSLAAQAWNPANASNYISLVWNREGQIVNAGSVVEAALTLSVSSIISGITDFSFNIVIAGTEST